jgi:hypothetical protein
MKKLVILLGFVLLISFIAALDFTPDGNINLRGLYNIQEWNITNCATGELVQGILSNGNWNCTATGAGSGDITSVQGDVYITNGTDDGAVNLVFNETHLNLTIDSKTSGLGNDSWNQTLANTLYADIIWGYNQTYSGSTFNATYAAHIQDNSSWNQSYAETLFLANGTNLDISPFNFTALWFFGNLNWSSLQNIPSYVKDWSFKLNATDQRYNETAFIEGVNTTENIEGLNFTQGAHTINTNTQKNAGSGLLYNDTTTIYGNYTEVNNTIISKVTQAFIEAFGFVTGAHTIDTNETVRFTNLVSDDCTGSNKMSGVQSNGTITCSAVAGGGDFSFTDFQGSFNLNFSAKTTDDLTQGLTNFYDNKSFNKSFTDTLYADIIWGYNQTSAANETIFNTYDSRWSTTFNSSYDAKVSFPGYANIALTNQSNNFAGNQFMNSNLTVDGTTLHVDSALSSVGIGTTNPLELLQVGDKLAGDKFLSFQTDNNAERGINYYLLDGTTIRGYMKWDSAEDLLLGGDSIKLEAIEDLHFDVGSVIDAMFIERITGNVGINTTNPTHELNVVGDVNFTNNLTVERINLEVNPANHNIYDNSTCVIITGSTSTFNIC